MITAEREFLRTRARVAAAAAHWRQEVEPADLLLPDGKPLAEAEDVLGPRRSELDPGRILSAVVHFFCVVSSTAFRIARARSSAARLRASGAKWA